MRSIAWFYIVAHALRCYRLPAAAVLWQGVTYHHVRALTSETSADLCYGEILGMNTGALRANLACAMLVTVVTVAICIAVHLIMDRFAPVLIGSSRHNLASQGKGMMGKHLRLAS